MRRGDTVSKDLSVEDVANLFRVVSKRETHRSTDRYMQWSFSWKWKV